MAMMIALPAAKRQRFVDSASLGCPPPLPSEIESLHVEICDFASINQSRGQCMETQKLRAHGRSWKLTVFPRGNHGSSLSTEYLSVYLICLDVQDNESFKDFKAKLVFKIGCDPQHIFTRSNESALYSSHKPKKNSKKGWKNMIRRSKILEDYLDDDGSLVIDVHIQIYGESQIWYPKPVPTNTILNKLLTNPEGSDVQFSVGENKEKFHAHKSILIHQAPVLYELVKSGQGEEITEIDIPRVAGPVFKVLLEHIYTGSLPTIDSHTSIMAEEIMDIADRFGLTYLKIHIESLITYNKVNTSNCTQWLLFSDAHSCPLLKESCLTLCANRTSDVMASSDWPMILESPALVSELLQCLAEKKESSSTILEVLSKCKDSNEVLESWNAAKKMKHTGCDCFGEMSVRKLREELELYGLDLDGTKNMLIHRLKEHYTTIHVNENDGGQSQSDDSISSANSEGSDSDSDNSDDDNNPGSDNDVAFGFDG